MHPYDDVRTVLLFQELQGNTHYVQHLVEQIFDEVHYINVVVQKTMNMGQMLGQSK
jgi:hypothetical protein